MGWRFNSATRLMYSVFLLADTAKSKLESLSHFSVINNLDQNRLLTKSMTLLFWRYGFGQEVKPLSHQLSVALNPLTIVRMTNELSFNLFLIPDDWMKISWCHHNFGLTLRSRGFCSGYRSKPQLLNLPDPTRPTTRKIDPSMRLCQCTTKEV